MNKKKIIFSIIIVLVVVGIVLSAKQYLILRKAHSSFENYYNFRGCVQLIDKTDTSGTCITSSGQTIKIVEYNNKWYLDGDLPWFR